MLVMLVVGRLRQEDHELNTGLVATLDPVSRRKIKQSQRTTAKTDFSPPEIRFLFFLSLLPWKAILKAPVLSDLSRVSIAGSAKFPCCETK